MPTRNGLINIPVNQIFLDDSYGRQPRPFKIDFFVKNWNRDKANVILVSERDDGRYACLDGWHRRTACERVEGKHSTLPCLVYVGMTIEEEAAEWVSCNKDRTPPVPAEVFRARLEAGDIRARAIDAIVRRLGLNVSTNRGKGNIRAVRALERVYEMDGGITLERVLSLLRQAWAEMLFRDPYSEPAIHGLGLFLVRFDVPNGEVLKVLEREGPAGLRAEMYHVRQLTHGDIGVAWGRGFREKYNWRRSSQRLPEWPEKVMSPGARQRKREARVA